MSIIDRTAHAAVAACIAAAFIVGASAAPIWLGLLLGTAGGIGVQLYREVTEERALGRSRSLGLRPFRLWMLGAILESDIIDGAVGGAAAVVIARALGVGQ